MKILDRLRLAGSQGANRAMEAELKRVFPRVSSNPLPKPERAGEQTLLYPYQDDLAWVAANWLRTPSRIFWDLIEVEERPLEPLYEVLFDWVAHGQHPWRWSGARFSVTVRDIADFPAGPLQVRGVLKNALLDGSRACKNAMVLDAEDPQLLFTVHAQPGVLTIALDVAGQSLHTRGYRRAIGEAPLKENLAAQMLMLARWDPRHEMLLDPLAGSGTIAIEAAAMATGAPLWVPPRRPACADWAQFAKRPKPVELFPGTRPVVVANELDKLTMVALRENVIRAKTTVPVISHEGDFKDLGRRLRRILAEGGADTNALERGLILTNPPLGQRLESSETIQETYLELRALWQSLGEGWRIGFLSPDSQVESVFGQPNLKKPISLGPLKIWFLVYDRL